MPWKDCTVIANRIEFVKLACQPGANMSLLCRRFGIARKNGYKWRRRYRESGLAGLQDQSRRPQHSPGQTPLVLEQQVTCLRKKHVVWGPRKLARRLKDLQVQDVPAPSTIASILKRHGLVDADQSRRRQEIVRFEYPLPNDLWQMDFKGHFPLVGGGRCHPLTVLDDHSRYNLVLKACDNERGVTVREHLVEAFRRYGLPRRILSDNGSPWGTSGSTICEQWTSLTVWLLSLNIRVIHGKPYRPQTQGKEERFHRTLREELLQWHAFADCAEAQQELDPWREIYNHQRPHDALNLDTPGKRYQPSARNYSEQLPPLEYAAGDTVRQVTRMAAITLNRRLFVIGKAFKGCIIALRATTVDGQWDVYYRHQHIGQIDERTGASIGRPRAVAAEPSHEEERLSPPPLPAEYCVRALPGA